MFEVVSHDELKDKLGEDTVRKLKVRLGGYFNLTKTFILEKYYIDREWREEYSLFYSTTFYGETSKFSTRIHLLNREISESEVNEIKQEDYLGFIVLRPKPLPNRILKILVNPIKELLGVKKDEDLYMCTCEFNSHIGGKKFKIETFPFYSQDSMVTVCAHACMWMVTMYLHKKYGMSRPYLKNLIAQTPPYYGRILPAEALYIDQIVYSLINNGYLASFKAFTPAEAEKCINRIDSYLESGLPTILLFDDHAVVVAGHTLDKNGNRDWIIFDDSGYHLKKFANTNQFAYRVEREKIRERIERENIAIILMKELLKNSTEKSDDNQTIRFEIARDKTPSVYTVNIEFERMYYPVESVYEIPKVLQRVLKVDLSTKQKRVLLVDSRKFKELYRNKGITIFEKINLPHYIWLIEIYDGNKLVSEIIVDASAHRYDFKLGSCIIAVWDNNEVKIYKDEERTINIRVPPIQFPNLTKIEGMKRG